MDLAIYNENLSQNRADIDAMQQSTEAYNNMAAHYANSDKAKAKELLNKTLSIDPTNQYALDSLKLLK